MIESFTMQIGSKFSDRERAWAGTRAFV